ncbi:hypothetical protein [Secundilactobacillus yichangensis]|uniref:hypothetical protein n=1 Tax=Secundilactobacillus yichangensis TaxID=2799580 RepID=UPI0019454BD5|nr:hypothetical protein [Secundilactobacillus yichangensis]
MIKPRYTAKELAAIEGDHDVMHCKDKNCSICNAYWRYATHLREQANELDPLTTATGKKPIKSWIQEQYRAGKSVREIAFNVNWDDDEVIDYLRERKLYHEPKRVHRRSRPEPVQIELPLGTTKTAKTIQQEQYQMTKLVWSGLSRQAIAKRMNKTVTAVGRYINTHDMPAVNQHPFSLFEVTYNGNQHRYFDKAGNEYELTRLE